MFIVCKIKANGTLIAGTPPRTYTEFDAAREEAERLASTVIDAQSFVIFRAHAKTERISIPVMTTIL